MRPNKLGWLLFAVFMAGFFLWRSIPEIWIGQILMGAAAVLYVVMTVRAKNAANEAAAELLNTGVRGRADILELTQRFSYGESAMAAAETGAQPEVKLRLQIWAPGMSPFETSGTVTVPLHLLRGLQSGRQLPVAFDAANPDKFVIDWSQVQVAADDIRLGKRAPRKRRR